MRAISSFRLAPAAAARVPPVCRRSWLCRRRHNHDLRHSFAVRTRLRWQRAGVNVDERTGALSAYLGPVAPADTYWYLPASPELMSLAAERLAGLEAHR